MTAVSRLQAPQTNGGVLVEPSFDSVPALIERNRATLAQDALSIFDRDIHDLRLQAKTDALNAAKTYLLETGEPLPELSKPESLLFAGHQPELFHPGVWVKNSALHRLARENNATPVNLIVDNDAAKPPVLLLPQTSNPLPPIEDHHVNLQMAAYDRSAPDCAYEERTVEDESFFAGFPSRLEMDWGYEPILNTYWKEAVQLRTRTPLLGERFVAARRRYEREWGCHNLEVPVSRLCQTEPFVYFFCHVLTGLPQFHHLYNAIVRGYRKRHDIGSKNHPVPDLARLDDWYETPFWGWTKAAAKRKRLFARIGKDRIALRAGDEDWAELELGSSLVESAVPLFDRDGEYKIRPRALTNTLYVRVFLADLFIHGLGGGKYDELTDELIRGFYGLRATEYLVLSATLQLPLPAYSSTPEDCRHLRRHWRDLRYNPQRHLGSDSSKKPEVRELINTKKQLVEQSYSSKQSRRIRARQIRSVNEKLGSYLGDERKRLHDRWQQCLQETRANAILRRRDYAYCLYPEALLRGFCTQFL